MFNFNLFVHIINGEYMKNNSIWSDYKNDKSYPKLNKNIKCDVLIIGGGITGISTAYHLSKSDLDICLVEKNTLGHAVTSKTTGKLTYLQENIYSKINAIHGKKKTKLYLDSQKDAINLVTNIIKDEKIKCDLEKVCSYVFTNDDSLKIEKELLTEIGVSFNENSILPNGEKVKDAYYVSDTYVFHPLKYIFSLADICSKNKVSIYENTKIIDINKDEKYYVCKTSNNIIKTKYVVLALHYPYFLFPFFMPLKSYIEKSYIEAFKVPKNNKFSSINISKPCISTRYHTSNNINYQLYLTNSHNLCVNDDYKDNFKGLINFKNSNPDYIWSNMDIMTSDKLPFIGALDKDKSLLLATGYNTWGMTNGSIAGKIINDIILKKNNKYIKLFDPKRKINIGKIMNFPLVLSSNAYSFIKSKVIKQKPWYSKNIKFEKRNGKNIAIYIDENKKEHIVYNTCPHLKCSLIFNEVEKTWDCPCHASRFDIDGKCLEGPSNYDITYKE